MDIFAEIRYAIRCLWKTRASTGVALVLLVGGMTLVTAAFSVVNLFVTKPLPFPRPAELVWLTPYDNERHTFAGASLDDVAAWQRADSFASVGGFRVRQFSLAGVPARGAEVTRGVLETLELQPIQGRLFTLDDYRGDGPRVVVLSQRLWETNYGADPGIVGRELQVDGESLLVIGVLPRIFRSYYAGYELWTPLTAVAPNRSERSLSAIGRMKSGRSIADGQAEMQVLSAQLAKADSGTVPRWETRIGALAGMMSDAIILYSILLVVVALVLVVICANLASLQLVRAATRQREIAVRFALGATRLRVVRQVLLEGALVGVTSGILALVLLTWVRRILVTTVPHLQELEIDPRVLGFALVVSLCTGLFFGLAPALVLSRTRLSEVMKTGSSWSINAQKRLRGFLAVGEIAVAVTLLAGVGLLVRSFISIQHVDPGIPVGKVLTATLSLPESRYPDAAQRDRLYRDVLQGISELPEVTGAAMTSELPLTGGIRTLQVRTSAKNEFQSLGGRVQTISPGYLRTMGIRLLHGREFGEEDGGGVPVALINRKLRDTLWPNRIPVGEHLEIEGQKPLLILGIVENAHQDLTSPAFPEIIVPCSQSAPYSMSLVIRTAGDPKAASLIRGLRHEVATIDPLLAVGSIQSFEEIVAGYFPLPLIAGIASFAVSTLLLACLGLYGVISHLVTLRSQEIGIRMALGASQTGISLLVLKEGLRLAGKGLLIGLGCALILGHLLAGFLFGVPRFDPALLVSVAVLALAVSLLALMLPALRAARVEPGYVLRAE